MSQLKSNLIANNVRRNSYVKNYSKAMLNLFTKDIGEKHAFKKIPQPLVYQTLQQFIMLHFAYILVNGQTSCDSDWYDARSYNMGCLYFNTTSDGT